MKKIGKKKREERKRARKYMIKGKDISSFIIAVFIKVTSFSWTMESHLAFHLQTVLSPKLSIHRAMVI